MEGNDEYFLHTEDGETVKRNGNPVILRNYVSKIRILGWDTHTYRDNNTATIKVVLKSGKKVRVETTGRMTVGEVIDSIVNEVMA